jgi:ribose/xylose/arabinose/galactoside ABC-type transport system permease subunit
MTTTTPPAAASGLSRRARLTLAGRTTLELILRIGGLFVAIIVVGTIFTLTTPDHAFLNTDVLISVLRAMASVAIMALGLTLVIVVGEIDLSVGAMYGLAANTLAVMWILDGVPVYFAIVLSLAIGAVVGAFNGVLVTFLRIPSFIVTLGTYNLLYGFSLYVTKATTFNPVYPPEGHHVDKSQLHFFTNLTKQIGSHQFSIEVFWMLGLFVVVGLLLHRSLFGFRLMAIGGNPAAAKVARLPVHRYKILAFVLSGVLASMAGILDFSFIQTTQPDIGLSQTFPVFAAVIIGGASLAGGKGTVVGTLGGALLLATLQVGLALLSLGPHAQQLFLGIVTIAAVALDLLVTRLRERAAT